MHSVTEINNSAEIFTYLSTLKSKSTVSSSSLSSPSKTNLNNSDLHKFCLDESYPPSSEIFNPILDNILSLSVTSHNNYADKISSSPYNNGNSECLIHHDHKPQLHQNYVEFVEDHYGFSCICHNCEVNHSIDLINTSFVINDANKTLSQSTVSSTLSSTGLACLSVSSQLNSNNIDDDEQRGTIEQTKTFLKRFQNFITHSVKRKSNRLLRNYNENFGTCDDHNNLYTIKGSTVSKSHLISYHKKRSKSLRTISNCVQSKCSFNNNNDSDNSGIQQKHDRIKMPHCLDDDIHSDKYFTHSNTKKPTCHHFGLVSRAVEKFISNLNEALDCLADNRNTTTITFVNSNCNPLHHLYGPFKQLLMELAIVLQCKQFNRDFVKCEGHCKLFHLVECIDKLDKKFHDEIWSYVLSCLLELSNHAITNRFIICNNTPNNNSSNSNNNNNNNNIKLYPHEICLTQENNDPQKYLSEEMLIQQDENINQIQYSSTSILPMKNVYGVEEFFSWQLVSDKFLSVIIEHCRKETNLECLLNEMKLLLKIMTDYPVHIQYVTKQTEQGFVLDLLKIIQLNIVGYKSAVNYNSTRLETLRCEIQNLIMKFLYVIFYYGKQQGHLVCLIHQFYENIQFTEWIPELRNRSLWELMINSYYRKKHHFDHSMMETFSSCLPSSDDNSENTVVLNFLKDFSNFLDNEALCETECIQSNNDNTNMNIYNPSIDNVEKEPQQRILSHRLSSNNSITNTTIHGHNNKQSSMQLLISVCRVQQVINSLLFTIMKTPLARTSKETVEKMKQLCSSVYFDEYTIYSTDQCIEEACIKLGFKIPTDPYADFEKPPGTLGFQCIYNYIMKNRNKLIDMLNYAYPCQKHSYLTTNTTNNHCKLNHLSEFNTLSSLNVNNNNDNINVNEMSSKSSQQRIQRHFSTVDSNSIKNILHTTHLHDDSIHNQRNNFTGRRFTMDSLIATSNLSQSFKPMKEYYSHNSFPCNYSISSSSTVSSSLIDKKPLFPIIEAANAVTSMLCELLATNDTIHEPIMIVEQDDKDFYLSSPLYPILLNKSNNNTNHYQSNLSSFEDIFDCVFSKFFSSWTQMKAVPEDLMAILCVVREQINRILKTIPISLEEFENSLIKFNPYDVPSMWSKRENRLRVDMLHNHPALIELRNDVRKRHQGHVYENRLNILSNSAPLEYIPSKGSKLCSKDNQSFTVLLSPDRKSLVIRDTNQIIREIWQLNCISRVSLGITEKVKKNPERTLLFQVELSDIPNQDDPNESTSNKPRCFRVTLLARSIIEYNYWLDGLFLLNKLNNPSDYYNEDVERLTELDMCIRLSSLDLNQLPKREISIPTDPPPPLDFI